MKVSLCAFFIVWSTIAGFGQNLVHNGSFEDKPYCPTSYNMQTLKTVKLWKQPNTATPDHFHGCTTGKAGVPKNMVGEQKALDGDIYGHISA